MPDRMTAAKFEPNENWVPPGYFVRHDARLVSSSHDYGTATVFEDSLAARITDDSSDIRATVSRPIEVREMEDFQDAGQNSSHTIITRNEGLDNFAIGTWEPSKMSSVMASVPLYLYLSMNVNHLDN
ncbi:unnamed protein product [Protopolystoma xenopodis]|uniref:Uncharacterized protein n=1 Tax=Protopolystoma xenopodis TaxID=117903 RepID=A0A448X7H7_9PLAT|nr:unnamed protein product [Protopolystoma xenopodis]